MEFLPIFAFVSVSSIWAKMWNLIFEPPKRNNIFTISGFTMSDENPAQPRPIVALVQANITIIMVLCQLCVKKGIENSGNQQ